MSSSVLSFSSTFLLPSSPWTCIRFILIHKKYSTSTFSLLSFLSSNYVSNPCSFPFFAVGLSLLYAFPIPLIGFISFTTVFSFIKLFILSTLHFPHHKLQQYILNDVTVLLLVHLHGPAIHHPCISVFHSLNTACYVWIWIKFPITFTTPWIWLSHYICKEEIALHARIFISLSGEFYIRILNL